MSRLYREQIDKEKEAAVETRWGVWWTSPKATVALFDLVDQIADLLGGCGGGHAILNTYCSFLILLLTSNWHSSNHSHAH